MHSLIIFGASGDLTSRKLIPAMYRLFLNKSLPDPTKIIGVSRTEMSDEQWHVILKESTKKFVKNFEESTWAEFTKLVHYSKGDINNLEDYRRLTNRLHEFEDGKPNTRIYYLSTSPKLYESAIERLGAIHKIDREMGRDTRLRGNTNRRIVIEKPFGTDLETAQALNKKVHSVFNEEQVYRIDHYLGKETVQNMMVFRFANTIFEPIWNRNYIDHVEITVAEEVAVGSRAGYYDGSGVLRDMFQNHLLQLLSIAAMDAPNRFEAGLVRDEKVKVLRAIRPWTDELIRTDTFRGQYDGYLNEEGVPAGSQTETFAALKLFVDNWRWKGVPFYLRSGKAMTCRSTQIVIQFHAPPMMLFGNGSEKFWDSNQLVIQIQPNEGIQMKFQTKVPAAGMKTRLANLDFRFQDEFKGEMPDAYQTLLDDVLEGDASLFARSDEVEFAWGIIDPIINAWSKGTGPELFNYPVGDWGPEESTRWMQDDGRQWFDVCCLRD